MYGWSAVHAQATLSPRLLSRGVADPRSNVVAGRCGLPLVLVLS